MALLTPPNPTEEVAQPALMASKSNRRRPTRGSTPGGRESAAAQAGLRESAALGVAGLPAEEIGPAAALQDPPTGTGTVPSSAGCCWKAAATCDPTASSFGQHQTTSGCRHAISTTQPATRGCGMRWDSAARRPKPARGSAPRSKEAGGDRPLASEAAATPRHGALPRRPDRGDTRVGAAWGGSAQGAEVTGRVEQAARHLADRPDVDDRDFRRALDLWLRTTDRAARRLDDNPDAPLPPDEVYALEAVVRADGTRPSLLVRNGVVDPVQPLAAGWTGQLTAAGDELTMAVAAIGRVEPKHPSGGDFFGTCWVVDHRNGLALTNRHVLDAMVERLPHAVARTTTGFGCSTAPSSTSPPSRAARTCAAIGSSRQPRPRSTAPTSPGSTPRCCASNRCRTVRRTSRTRSPSAPTPTGRSAAARLVLHRRLPGPAGVRVRHHRGCRLGLGHPDPVRKRVRGQTARTRHDPPSARLAPRRQTAVGVRPRRHHARRQLRLPRAGLDRQRVRPALRRPVHRHELRARRLGHHHRAPRPRRPDRRARMTPLLAAVEALHISVAILRLKDLDASKETPQNLSTSPDL